jgi:hypothetical protein
MPESGMAMKMSETSIIRRAEPRLARPLLKLLEAAAGSLQSLHRCLRSAGFELERQS